MDEADAVIQVFFNTSGRDPADDFYVHLCPANESQWMHIVLDLECRATPNVDLPSIEYDVFKARKKDDELFVVFSIQETVADP